MWMKADEGFSVRKIIPYSRQDVSEEDIEEVVRVLRSDFLTQGSSVTLFENDVASLCHVAHAVAVNSATSALHLSCLALGVGPGDIVWTSTISFVASANCALYCGATVDFVDIDARTYNICVGALEAKLRHAALSGKLPKVVIAVHMCGQPCDLRAIKNLSQFYGFKVIEDASHALGAKYLDKNVGSCEYSEITVFSFHPVKIITTGEGGMALTNDEVLAKIMRLLRTHGITKDPSEMQDGYDGPWYYQQKCLGFNFRMTDFQAALGRSQLRRLEEFVSRRTKIAQIYDTELSDIPISTPFHTIDSRSSFHLYVIRISESTEHITREVLYSELQRAGINVNVHYIPIHLQPFFRKMNFNPGDFPASEHYYREALSLPIFPRMKECEQTKVIDLVRNSFLNL